MYTVQYVQEWTMWKRTHGSRWRRIMQKEWQGRQVIGAVSRLAVKRVKTELRGHFFIQRVFEGWNKLPVVTRDAKNVRDFKRELKIYRERADLWNAENVRDSENWKSTGNERTSERVKMTSKQRTRNGGHRTKCGHHRHEPRGLSGDQRTSTRKY